MPTHIISIAQQEVPKVKGHTELDLAQFAIGLTTWDKNSTA
jgi:hypothetical protein